MVVNGRADRTTAPQLRLGEPALDFGEAAEVVPLNGRPTRRPPLRDSTASSPRVSVIIPTLNEAQNIAIVLGALPAGLFEVIVVDGRSTDDTVAVAQEAMPTCRVVMQTGRGKGNALACGFAAAGGDIIVALDADGSTDPAEIPLFVGALLSGADFVKGSRRVVGGGSADLTRFRRMGDRSLRFVINVLFRTRYTDPNYGYNAFWRHCLPHLAVDCDGFEVETLMNLRAAKAGLLVKEVPCYELARMYGGSNLRAVSDGWRILKTIVRERRTPAAAPVPVAVAEVLTSDVEVVLDAEVMALVPEAASSRPV